MTRVAAEAVYHAGQLAVQARAGAAGEAGELARIVRPALPPPARAFLEAQRLLVVASVAADGRPWASALAGPPGFARAEDLRTVRIAARPAPLDPLPENLRATGVVGLLAIDLAARRRLRVNGRARLEPGGDVVVRTERVFGNCPSYIQRRVLDETPAGGEPSPPVEASRSPALRDRQRAWLEAADTFFVATRGPDGGAEASHRGGPAGFLQAPSEARLAWPDYPGNNMFLTLGNLEATGVAGLLALDFALGRTLQVVGRGRIDWDPARAAAFPGAVRVIELDVETAVESRLAEPLRWRGA